MRDTAEAISRDTDVPVDWVRASLEDLIRHDGLTPDRACVEVRLAYEATFHAFAHRAAITIGQLVRAAPRRVQRNRSVGMPR
jgi:hypothetical protein